MKFAVILNASAGAVSRDVSDLTPESVAATFADVGIPASVIAAEPPRLESELRAAFQSRPDAVVIGGGDGTVRTAAALAVETGVPLGVLPLGTLNHFAKDLGLPADWRETVAVLATANAAAIDVGEVNGQVFINNCSIGSYAEAVRRRDALRREHGQTKWRAMLQASWVVFRQFRRLRLRLTRDGATRDIRTPLLVVANNRYSGPVLSTSLRDRLDEGRLWIYAVRAHRKLALLRMVVQALCRRLDGADDLEAEPARDLIVEAPAGKLPVAADGELIEVTAPLHFRIRPGALVVLKPRIQP